MVGLSFVRSPQDVLNLGHELDRRNGSHLGNVMTRMQTHQTKKRAMLRKLSVSDRIVDIHPLRPPVHMTDRNGV
jgi:hypothetical protein